MQHQGKLVLIIGPSGVGKSVLLKALRKRHSEWHFPRSATTRPQRQGEDTTLYRFVTDEEFDRFLDEGMFLEWAAVHRGARYGTLLEEIIPEIENGKIVVREVDVQGFDSIRTHRSFRKPDAPYRLQSIFILPEDSAILARRIRTRAPIDDAELQHRLASMEKEFTYADLCDVRIINREGKLEEAIQETEKAIG